MKYCIYCGAKIHEGTKFCIKCGKPIETPLPFLPKEEPVTDQTKSETVDEADPLDLDTIPSCQRENEGRIEIEITAESIEEMEDDHVDENQKPLDQSFAITDTPVISEEECDNAEMNDDGNNCVGSLNDSSIRQTEKDQEEIIPPADGQPNDRDCSERVGAQKHQETEEATTGVRESKKTVCPSCGRELAPGAVFCNYCGAEVDHSEEIGFAHKEESDERSEIKEVISQKTSTRRNLVLYKGRIVGVALATCAVILAVCFATHIICFHDWREATCINPETCTKCGKTQGEPKGHSLTDATCTKAAKCTVCGQIKGFALGHDVESWKTDEEASCEKKGVRHGKCERCGEEITEEVVALGHDWSEWKTLKEATIKGDGEKKHTCSRCGKTEKQKVVFVDEVPEGYESTQDFGKEHEVRFEKIADDCYEMIIDDDIKTNFSFNDMEKCALYAMRKAYQYSGSLDIAVSGSYEDPYLPAFSYNSLYGNNIVIMRDYYDEDDEIGKPYEWRIYQEDINNYVTK